MVGVLVSIGFPLFVLVPYPPQNPCGGDQHYSELCVIHLASPFPFLHLWVGASAQDHTQFRGVFQASPPPRADGPLFASVFGVPEPCQTIHYSSLLGKREGVGTAGVGVGVQAKRVAGHPERGHIGAGPVFDVQARLTARQTLVPVLW
jgi:hypothetical protein